MDATRVAAGSVRGVCHADGVPLGAGVPGGRDDSGCVRAIHWRTSCGWVHRRDSVACRQPSGRARRDLQGNVGGISPCHRKYRGFQRQPCTGAQRRGRQAMLRSHHFLGCEPAAFVSNPCAPPPTHASSPSSAGLLASLGTTAVAAPLGGDALTSAKYRPGSGGHGTEAMSTAATLGGLAAARSRGAARRCEARSRAAIVAPTRVEAFGRCRQHRHVLAADNGKPGVWASRVWNVVPKHVGRLSPARVCDGVKGGPSIHVPDAHSVKLDCIRLRPLPRHGQAAEPTGDAHFCGETGAACAQLWRVGSHAHSY